MPAPPLPHSLQTTQARHSDVHTHQLCLRHQHTLLRTQPGGQTDTHAWAHGRGHATLRLTRSHVPRPHTRTPARSPPAEPGARAARARGPPSAPVRVTAPRPGPRPFPGRGPIQLGPGLRPLTGAEDGAQGASGRPESWVRQELAAPRPHARPLAVPPPPVRAARARAPAPPRRGAAPPPALVRARHAGLGGAGAAASPRWIPPRSQELWRAGDSLSPGAPPHFKDSVTEAQTHTASPASISPSSGALDTEG